MLNLHVVTPGNFIDMLYEKVPARVISAMEKVISDLENPPYTKSDLAAALTLHGATNTAEKLLKHLELTDAGV